jgi:hypothetical protein
MAGKSTFISQTLQSITTTKMREQSKRRSTFEEQKAKIIEDAKASHDERVRLDILLSGFKNLSASNKGVWYVDKDRKHVVHNVTRYLVRSKNVSLRHQSIIC